MYIWKSGSSVRITMLRLLFGFKKNASKSPQEMISIPKDRQRAFSCDEVVHFARFAAASAMRGTGAYSSPGILNGNRSRASLGFRWSSGDGFMGFYNEAQFGDRSEAAFVFE